MLDHTKQPVFKWRKGIFFKGFFTDEDKHLKCLSTNWPLLGSEQKLSLLKILKFDAFFYLKVQNYNVEETVYLG